MKVAEEEPAASSPDTSESDLLPSDSSITGDDSGNGGPDEIGDGGPDEDSFVFVTKDFVRYVRAGKRCRDADDEAGGPTKKRKIAARPMRVASAAYRIFIRNPAKVDNFWSRMAQKYPLTSIEEVQGEQTPEDWQTGLTLHSQDPATPPTSASLLHHHLPPQRFHPRIADARRVPRLTVISRPLSLYLPSPLFPPALS